MIVRRQRRKDNVGCGASRQEYACLILRCEKSVFAIVTSWIFILLAENAVGAASLTVSRAQLIVVDGGE
jgi:hypothetical protein